MAGSFKHGMASRVRDVVTNYVGTITARCEYIGESNSYRVERSLTDVKPGDEKTSEWFNEDRLQQA